MSIDVDTRPSDTDPGPRDDLGAGLLAALDGPFHDERQRTRAELRPEEVLRDPLQSVDDAREWTLRALQALAGHEFGRAGTDPQYGGRGPLAHSVVHFELLCAADMSLAIKSGVQHGLYGGAIWNLGTAWHHERFLADALEVRTPGCFGMTEQGHGSDVSGLETTITYDERTAEYVVHSPTPTATKTYIGNAGAHGRMAVVFGQLIVGPKLHGIHAILVPIRDADGADMPGVTCGDNGHKGGLLGVDNGTLTFDHVRVPRELLLDRYGGVGADGVYRSPIDNANRRFFTMLGTLVRGRVCIGGGAATAARKALTIATTYAVRRRQFVAPGHPEGVVLLDYLAHQRRLLPAIATAYAYGFAQNRLIERLAEVALLEGGDERAQRELEARAAGLKAVQSRFANDAVQACREACGGAGYMTESGLTTIRQDVDVFATFEGDNTVLLQLVAKQLLGDYKQAWVGLDPVKLVQASAKSLGGAVVDRTANLPGVDRLVAAAQGTGADTVEHRGWQVSMFEERERHVVGRLAARLRSAARSGEAAFAATNKAQDHMLYAARAHMDKVVLESFVAGIEACPDPAVKDVLGRLCDLYALSVLEAERAWYLERGRISPQRAKALTQAVNRLCGELRPLADDLVTGLGIPTAWLQSAMLGAKMEA
ncbi:acyl-CoA dehydrogenase [Propionicicella superfundia]|uniref:acyl-CoA dehydrogenase family protein n=1 Tax=Propionicicella superfundia TaxID=348582 RepID=UPI000429ABA9|nr:acyl-CoA dehydrogenase [Propionicicella superfundia]